MFSDPLREWEGVRAPDFTLTTLDGSTVRLGELRGKRVFVDVWATWCPPCRA
ncbi:MAG: redoxin domain-containing protein, partial [Candidatus Hydrogenedentes bacterium]|nr:redoxin domain-containing protein [Candidatus Hydrogenedentota bacterium]